MYNTTDIQSLGTDYTVADQKGNVIKNVQVIPHDEILSAALGPYTEDFGSYQEYLEKSIAVLSGFDDIDASKVMWYSTMKEEIALSEVIEYAIRHGFDRIILEHLEDIE